MDDTFKPVAHSSKPLTNSSRALGQTLTRHAEQTEFATERARLLLGQFRRGEANDPAVFVTSVAAVLSRYRREIIIEVTDPRTGLALKTNWLPTIREVGDACQALDDAAQAREKRDFDLEKQLASRVDDTVPEQRPTLADLREKYGPNWGLTPAPKKHVVDPMEVLLRVGAEVGITREAIEALPNAPERRK